MPSLGAPAGVPYELLVVTNAQKEPGFAPPDGVTWKNALKYQTVDHKNVYFSDTYYPKPEDELQQHSIHYVRDINLDSDTRYQISFWIKGDGVHDASYKFNGWRSRNPGVDDDNKIRLNLPRPQASVPRGAR